MFDRFLNKAAELLNAGEPFVVATVVRFEAPISGKPGDKAIIRVDGSMWGWIGGGCSEPVVIAEALKALADGRPRLVRISPTAEPGAKGGVVDYTMTCHSGGSLDIYIEPVLAKPHILILGRSPVAQTLARLGQAIHYEISVVAEVGVEGFPGAGRIASSIGELKVTPQTMIVVSTQGEDDEDALEQALGSGAEYVAFVASKIKAQKVMERLQEKGVAAGRLRQVKAPAGLDIHAASPEEIAVSILAEIIQTRGSRLRTAAEPGAANKSVSLPVINTVAKDPICGMMVDTAKAKHRSEFQGKGVYFCCAGCKQTFDQHPEKYAV
ncbi:MAG TPA: XdhC family protein [Candidatus Saccharimonadales bacterium]|jgi:xanthine dehydrogenase accessory factor|nr:XdhC family protein [Candidatus Saccharimonadales bacterium]